MEKEFGMLPDKLFDKLVAMLQEYQTTDIKMIYHAYELASIAHKNQKRKSGEAYIIHPLSVAIILAGVKMDEQTIAASLMHDVVEDTLLNLS